MKFMKLKLTVLLFAGLLMACGDKQAASTGDMILAVRSPENNGTFPNGDNIQVALLDANHIESEEDAVEAAKNARWVSIDDFSNDNVVFREEDDDTPELENNYSHARRRGGHRRCHRRIRGPRRGHRHPWLRHAHRRSRGRCWRPYRRPWVRRRIRVSYRDCSLGYLYRRGRCVIPFTPVHTYYWFPRYTTGISVVWRWNSGPRRRPHRRRGRGHDSSVRLVFYF